MNTPKGIGMMRVELLTASGLLLALASGASLVSAQVMPSAGLQRAFGKIVLVDPAKRLLRLEPEQPSDGTGAAMKLMEFVLSADTAIKEGDRKLKTGELRIGTQVRVDYKVQGNTHIAQSITVEKPTATGGSAEPEGVRTGPQGSERPQAPGPFDR